MMRAIVDNPLLIKHVRSRLRRQHVLPMCVVVGILGGCILWGGLIAPDFLRSGMFVTLYTLLGAVLLLGGTSQVAAAVGGANRSKILDFHRASPLPARQQVIGFVLGAPIREYVAGSVLLPFLAFAAIKGNIGLVNGLVLLALLVLSALLFHTLACVAGLLTTRQRTGGGGVAGLVILSAVLSPLVERGVALPGLLTPIPALREVLGTARAQASVLEITYPTFFGAEVPLVLQSVLYQGLLLAFLFNAAVRRMRSDRAHIFSKPTSIALQLTVAVLALGGLIGRENQLIDTAMPALLTVLGASACIAILAVTPDASSFRNGLRRAAKSGLPRPHIWRDEAPNWATVGAIAAITAIAGGTLIPLAEATESDDALIAIGIGATAIAYFGWAIQYCALAFGRRAVPYTMLLLFFLWIVPLLVGGLLAASGAGDIGKYVVTLCPVAGVASPNTVALTVNSLLAVMFFTLGRRAELADSATASPSAAAA